MRLREAGETRLVGMLVEVVRRLWPCRGLEPDDDAACVPGHENLLFKIDGYSIASSRLPWMSLADVGWKAVVAAASDVLAKAGRPIAVMASIGLPADTSVEDAVALVQGIADAASVVGARLVGGDTNVDPGGKGWVDIAVVGELVASEPLARRPRQGDVVYTTTGRYGLTGIAFHALRENNVGVLDEYPRVAEETRRPKPRTLFPLLASRLANCMTASIDVSDGLAYTLYRLAWSANARLVVEHLPAEPEAEEYARRHRVSLHELVFYAGEEYEIVFTVRPGCENLVASEAARLGLSVEKLGALLPGEPVVELASGGRVEPVRWDSFKGFMAVANGP